MQSILPQGFLHLCQAVYGHMIRRLIWLYFFVLCLYFMPLLVP